MDIIFWVCFVWWFFGYYWIPQKYHNPNQLFSSAFFRPPIMIYLKMIQKLQFTNWLFLFQGNETREIFFLLRSTRLMTPQEKFEKKSKYITYPCTFTYSHIHTLYPCSFTITTTIVYNFSDFYTCGYLKYAKWSKW